MANGFKIDREHLKPVPVGKSDWEGFSQTNYTVDKTLLIKEPLDDDTAVAIFTHPLEPRVGRRAFRHRTEAAHSRLSRRDGHPEARPRLLQVAR